MMRHFVVLVATLCVCFGFSNAAEFGKSGNYVRKGKTNLTTLFQ